MGANDASPCVTVLTTAGDADQAKALARGLVERRLAACVQSAPVSSCYVWDGRLNEESEVLLLIKTRAELYGEVEATIRDMHPYATPEIVCLPIVAGSRAYLDWICEVTRPAASGGG